MFDAYIEAETLLDKSQECTRIFGSDSTRAAGWSPAVILAKLVFGTGGYGSIGYGPTLGQLALTVPTIAGMALAAQINLSTTAFVGESTLERARTLLHELGHAFNLLSLRGSGGSQVEQGDFIPSRQTFNQTLIEKKCGQ